MLKKFNSYLKNSKFSIILSVIFLLAAFGEMVISSSISIDSEFYINRATFDWWNKLGRWGLTLINKIFNIENLIIYLNNYFTIIFLIVAIIAFGFLIYLYIPKKYRDTYLKYQFIFPIIFLTSPIFAEQFNFTMQNFAVSLSMALVPIIFIGYYYSKNFNKKIQILIDILLICITSVIFGVYQSLILFYVATFILIYLLKCLDNYKNNFKFLIIGIVRFGLSAVIYYIVCKILGSGNSYLQTGYSSGIKQVIINIYHVIVSMIKCESIFYNVSYLIALFILICLTIYIIIKKKLNVGISLGIIGLILSPYLIMIVTGVDQLKRTQFNYSFFIGIIICAFAVLLLNNDKKLYIKCLGYFIVLLSLGIAYRQSFITATLFQSNSIRYNEDIRLAEKIQTSIENKDWYDQNKKYTLILVGRSIPDIKTEYLKGEVIGSSFFEFDYQYYYGVDHRAVVFMNILGNEYKLSTDKQFKQAKKYVQKNNTEIYPNNNSIQLLDDNIIIVRLSEEI